MFATTLVSGSLIGAGTRTSYITDLRKIRDLFDAERKSDGDRLVRERYKAHYWEAWSPRLDRRVGLYGDIGHDHWVLIESDPSISWFTERPSRIWLQVARRLHARPFEMVVERQGDIECRRFIDDEADLTDAQYDALQAEQEWCEAQRFSYQVFKRADIERERQRIENWKRMLPYLFPGRRHEYIEDEIYCYVSMAAELTLAEIDRLLPNVAPTVVRASVYALLHRGVIVAPALSDRSLSAQLTVRTRHES